MEFDGSPAFLCLRTVDMNKQFFCTIISLSVSRKRANSVQRGTKDVHIFCTSHLLGTAKKLVKSILNFVVMAEKLLLFHDDSQNSSDEPRDIS